MHAGYLTAGRRCNAALHPTEGPGQSAPPTGSDAPRVRWCHGQVQAQHLTTDHAVTRRYTRRDASGLGVAQEVGPATAQLVTALLAEPTLTRLREVQALLRLTARYPFERLERACARATAAGDGRYRTVRGILERDLDSVALEPEPPPQAAGAFLRGPAAFGSAADDAQAVAGW